MTSADSILAALDPEQRAVATSLDVPTVVVAGAGTGKTRAITHRIAYAVAAGRYDARSVLAVTFTTRAAGEMRGRLSALGVPGVQARTFHSAALRQAQYFWPQAYGAPLPPVSDARFGMVAEAAGRLRLPTETAALRDLVSEIGWAKVSNVGPDDYARIAAQEGREISAADPQTVARVFAAYEQNKRDRGVIDFDDILLCTAALLDEHPQVADQVRRQYRHFVVDEYQDVSPLQEAVLRLWLGDGRDICVVGDPAQTIHTFAGADRDFLLHFQRRHRDARRIELVRDYRSTPQVVALANAVMRRSGEAVTLLAQREDGPAVEFEAAANEADEAAAVAEWLRARHDEGVEYRELAALFRINAQSPALEAALAERGIPYLVRGAERFYERAEVRQAMVALRGAAKASSDDVVADVKAVFSGIGWSETAPSSGGAQRERWESLAALVSVVEDLVAEAAESGAEAPQLDNVVAELELRAQTQEAPIGQGVVLATLHAAKGLEWDGVALFGCHEGTLPFSLAATPAQLAEERRLLYVGITRARRHLHISWARSRNGTNGNRGPSRFLDGLIPAEAASAAPARARRRRGSALAATCRVCGLHLASAAERKLGRHEDCESSYDEATLEALKAWRKQEAEEQRVPAYCVFTDATLVAIAEATPANEAELIRMPGVGRSKLGKYGDAVLAIVSGGAPSA